MRCSCPTWISVLLEARPDPGAIGFGACLDFVGGGGRGKYA